jgi:hypothetical protein
MGRGVLLHAAAVCLQGKGIVFLAPSSGGKSTMAAKLLSCGHTPLGDDIVIICRNTNQRYMVHPSARFVSSLGWQPPSCELTCLAFLEKGAPSLIARLSPEYAFFRGVRDRHLVALDLLDPLEKRTVMGGFGELIDRHPCYLLRFGISTDTCSIIKKLLNGL